MGRKKKKNKTKGESLTKKIKEVFLNQPKTSLNYKQVAASLGINDPSGRNQIVKSLKKLTLQKELNETVRGKYTLKQKPLLFEGTLDVAQSGNGYLVSEEFEDDIFIKKKQLLTAFNGDTVSFRLFKTRGKKKEQAEILSVVKRSKTRFVGILQLQNNTAFVCVGNGNIYPDFFINNTNIDVEKEGQKVVIELEKWNNPKKSPQAKIVKFLGTPGTHHAEIHGILEEFGLPYEFSLEVLKAANEIDTSIQTKEIKKRRDFRDVLTFTVDPKDAKDFDDALSFQVLENGDYEIGIHIADVSHYIEKDGILDKEAYQRATSVYLVDRVVPMLPEILSNQACSLRPHEEKYTFSAVFVINKDGKIKNQWFGRTVILSDQRFAYEEAQHVIEAQTPKIPQEISLTKQTYSIAQPLVEAICVMNELAKKMRQKRMKSGAISFDKIEVKFILDKNNHPSNVFFKEAKDANKMIEEFMLLANKKVAEFIGKQEPIKKFIYRVHDEPNIEKLAQLQRVVGKFGHKLNFSNEKNISSSLNRLLKDVQGKKEQNLVDTLTIRTMSKAEYTTQNIGHYGLAFDYYTHFTSPIRRYPDVLVHRLLQTYLNNQQPSTKESLEEICKHSSFMEQVATKAERNSIKYMQVKYMSQYINQQFVGVISGATERGMYVEIIENKCEGMIRIQDIPNDFFIFDEKEYIFVGRKTKETYQLGDEVVVKVLKTDIIKRHLDLQLIGKKEN
ncbi:MAG: ribonuclease R [Flavobacteriaceae bacterium]|nr:ribonuclease R [Flavobacteriaceae bacterium]MDG2314737.1 ribonuclease R [Flavobacteriaceae bacterium]